MVKGLSFTIYHCLRPLVIMGIDERLWLLARAFKPSLLKII